MPLDVAHHSGRAGRTLRLATSRGMLPIQLFELGGLLVIEHLTDIVIVLQFRAHLVSIHGSLAPTSPARGPRASGRRMRRRSGVAPG